MSTSNPHRPPDPDELGYEVVEDPGYEVVDAPPPAAPRPAAPRAVNPAYPPAKPLPAIPAAKPLPAKPVPAARVAAKRVAGDHGVGVVAEPAARPVKPKVRVVADDDDTEEAPRSKAKTKRIRPIDDDEDDPPRRKKPKRRSESARPASEEESSALAEWAGPAFLMLVGLVLSAVGTWGMAKGADAAVAPVAAVFFRVIGEVITIPITIVALMVIGSMFGIEYGTFTNAVRSLAAMGFLIGGLTDAFAWSKLPFFVYEPIIFLIGIGVFMALFRLDVWETMVTMFCLNVLSWVFQFVALLVILAVLAKGGHKDDFDAGPKSNDRQGQRADPGFGGHPDDPPPGPGGDD